MKAKKILCPKCKHGNLAAVTVAPLFIGYDIHQGQAVDDSKQTVIESMRTVFRCKKCQHTWKSKRKLPFSIKIGTEE